MDIGCLSYLVGNPEEDILGGDVFDFNLLIIQGNSSQNVLPKLEFLEANGIRGFTDEDILRLLTNRIDAALRGVVSPLRHLKLQMLRQRQRDIREEAFELARSAGFELKLELIYPPESPPYRGRLSPSFSYPLMVSLQEAWPPTLDFLFE